MTPSGWKPATLGDDAILLSGQHILAEECSDLPGEFPYLTGPSDFQDGVIRPTKYVRSPKVMCEAGDLLVTIKGSGTGKLVPADRAYCISRQLAAVRPRSWWKPFVFHVLTSYQSRLQGDATGLIPGLSRDDLLGLPILLPPLPEQRKIAGILSSVDDAIDRTQAVIDQLAVVKKAMMQELLTKGLPGRHTRFKKTEIGMVPEEWGVVPLGAVCQRITDGSHQSVATSPSGDVPFLYVSCIRDGRILWDRAARISGEQYSTVARGREPAVGSVLYTAVGSYGHAAAVVDDKRFTFQRHIAYLVPESNQLDPSFLAGWLNSPSGRDHADRVAVGNAQKTVTLGKLKDFPLPLPPLEEQDRIASVAQSLDNRMNAEAEGRDALRTLKSALMSVLLTGEVRVTPDEDAA